MAMVEASRGLGLGLLPQVLVPLQHRATQLVHKVRRLVHLVPHLAMAPGLEAPLQQPHLLQVCLAHLRHHLHGLLALPRQLAGLPVRLPHSGRKAKEEPFRHEDTKSRGAA